MFLHLSFKIVFWNKYLYLISSLCKPNIAWFMSCVTKYISCMDPQNFSCCISSVAQTHAMQYVDLIAFFLFSM